MRLSIDISPEQHQLLEAAAALQGKTIRDYVLDIALSHSGEQAVFNERESFLKPRFKAEEGVELSDKSVNDIFDEVERQNKGSSNARAD